MKLFLLITILINIGIAQAEILSLRISDENIKKVSATLSPPDGKCSGDDLTGFTPLLTHQTKVHLTTGETIALKSLVADPSYLGSSCAHVIGATNTKGNALLNEINSIKFQDVYLMQGEHPTCSKYIAYVSYDTETGEGSNYKTKLVAVKCP